MSYTGTQTYRHIHNMEKSCLEHPKIVKSFQKPEHKIFRDINKILCTKKIINIHF